MAIEPNRPMDTDLCFGGSGAGRVRTFAAVLLLAFGLTACATDDPNVRPVVETAAPAEDVASLMRLADGLRERGELSTAIALYQRAASRSDDAVALIQLGRALADVGADQQAAGAFRRALSRSPGNADALLGLGTTYLTLGEVEKSIRYLEELVGQGEGGNTVAYAALGAAFDIAGRRERAVAAYEAGLERTPDDLDLLSNLALSYAFQDLHVEAIDLMTDVADALDANRSHQRNLVLILALAGQDRRAVATGIRLLGERETQDVLAQAASVRRLPPGAARARAIGLS